MDNACLHIRKKVRSSWKRTYRIQKIRRRAEREEEGGRRGGGRGGRRGRGKGGSNVGSSGEKEKRGSRGLEE